VIARSSSFAFVSDKLDPRIIGQKLSAKYVLEGRLKRAGDGFSVAVSLSDAVTGYSMWSHRVPLPPDRSQDALDPIVAELVGVLDAQIDYAEQVRVRGNRQNLLAFNDLIWRGRWHLNRLTRADSEMARKLFEEALELEPNSPEAIIQATFRIGWSIWARRGGDAEIAEMRHMAHRAIVADPDDGRGHMLAGIAEMWLRQTGRARTLLERAIALNPSLCQAYAQLGCHYNLVGEPAAAIGPLQRSQRLSPNDVHIFFIIGELALSHWMLGKHAEAIEYADQSLIRRPAYWYTIAVKINALVGSGDLAAARRAYDELMTVKPDFTPQFIEWTPFIDRTWNRRLADGVATVMNDHKPASRRRR
jgi:tetratricopeptide (TPR) repeat protein